MAVGAGLSKAQIKFWTSSEVLLTKVAEFLTLKDLCHLLTAHPEFLSVTFVPTPTRIADLVLHASSPDIRVNPAHVVIRDVRNGRVMKELSYRCLCALRCMLRSIPADCELPAEFSGIHAERQEGESTLCRFMTVPSFGVHQSAEVVLAYKRCEALQSVKHKVVQCRRNVFVECRACKEICCACSNHQAHCDLTQHSVCPDCIVPSNGAITQGQPATMCMACGFQCFTCAEALPNDHRFKCSAKADCMAQNKLCQSCVFDGGALQIISCQLCHKTWCLGCVEFPVCVACGPTACPNCADLSHCSNCNVACHGDCTWESGGMECGLCENFLCENCRNLPIIGAFECCFEDCEDDMCLACAAQDRTRVCEQGHTTCNFCIEKSVMWCNQMEINYGGSLVDVDRSCFACSSEAFASLKGFDDYADFSTSLYPIPARIEEVYQDKVQMWRLGGSTHPDTNKFSTCSALWRQLETDYLDIRINKILSQLTLIEVTVWESSFVNGVHTFLFFVDANDNLTPLSTTTALGNHNAPTSRALFLDHTKGERVASVHVRSGVIIDNLRIVTTTGREMTWGGPGGENTVNYRVPNGWKVVGFFGGVGGHLHNLGVIIVADDTITAPAVVDET